MGASANLVIVGVASRNSLHIGFGQWLRYGIPAAALSLAICVPYLLLRHA